jgi:hypothetical protein
MKKLEWKQEIVGEARKFEQWVTDIGLAHIVIVKTINGYRAIEYYPTKSGGLINCPASGKVYNSLEEAQVDVQNCVEPVSFLEL